MRKSIAESRKPLPGAITLTANEYAQIYNASLKRACIALKDGTERLHKCTLKLIGEDGQRGRSIRWLQAPAVYADWEGAVTLRFSEVVKPHISLINHCFTAYELEKVANLQSTYSLRFYELLTSWRSTGRLLIRLEDFRCRLGLEGPYSRFDNLKNRVIDPAVKELAQKSGLEIEWEVKRRGCTAVSLAFRFREKALKGSKLLRFPNK
ncbi:MAG: replication initiation protein [Candidatus Thiodiazotropha sp. (ex Lucinoma kastoroae)]|nr:replication initiation protein [Candidatus Thiodiazotropha sp. (ex Lucinoma kastoroae)]MCU7861929.1 replication initiation protein [Candidatus Thiodiazotropha sp. (ex Lucinoma kastoroae)]